MRLLARAILLGTPRPHRHPPEAETAQQFANRSFGQPDAVALLDHPRQFDPSPAHHTVLDRPQRKCQPAARRFRRIVNGWPTG
jgi:hypothetical protein